MRFIQFSSAQLPHEQILVYCGKYIGEGGDQLPKKHLRADIKWQTWRCRWRSTSYCRDAYNCDTAYRQLLWIQRKIKRTKKTKTEPEKKAKPNPNLIQEKAKIKQKKATPRKATRKKSKKKQKKKQKKAKKKQKKAKKSKKKQNKKQQKILSPDSWSSIMVPSSQ